MRISELHPTPTDAEPLEIPAELMDSVIHHQAHLAALIASLRDAGFHENMVATSVRTLIDSYADELTVAIRGMMRSQHSG